MHPLTRALLDVIAGSPPRWEGDDERLVRGLEHRGLGALAVSDARCREAAGEPAGLAEAVLAGLGPVYHASALHTTLVSEAAERAAGALEEAGIGVLFFKGVALLCEGVYSDPGARPVQDVDLLVRPEDTPAAVEVLGETGFEPWAPWEVSRMTWLSSFTFADATAPERMRPALDLHWATPYADLRLAGPWGEDPLWERSSGRLPAPEPHFVLLAEHLLKHLRVLSHLRGLADLVRLAPRLGDAELLVRQARRRGSLPGLRSVMALLREHLGVVLDDAVVRRVGARSALRGRAARHLDPEGLIGTGSGDRPRLGGVLGSWMTIGSPVRSAARLARVVAPPARWLRARYPDEGRLGRRTRYVRELIRWTRGRGISPLAPNQEEGE